jgi:hypothetical protein
MTYTDCKRRSRRRIHLKYKYGGSSAIADDRKDEFYSIAFRKKIYHSLEELQQDVDEWLVGYNHQNPYSGRYCYGKTPMQTFGQSKHLAEAKMLDRQQALVGCHDSIPIVS